MAANYRDSTGAANATTCAMPTCVVGDIIVGRVRGVGAQTPSAFSGGTDYIDNGFTWMGSKVADSLDEAGGTYNGLDDPGDMCFASFAGGSTPVYGGEGSGTGTTATSPSVATGGDDGCLVMFFMSLDTAFSGTTPSGGTLRENFGGSTSVSTDHELWTQDGVNSPTGTRDRGLGSSDWETASVFVTSAITGPAVSSFDPADNATGVSRTVEPEITWDQAVDAGTGEFTITEEGLDGGVFATLDVTNGSEVTVSGSTVTLHLPGPLEYSRRYYITWPAGIVVADSGGAPCSANTSATTWNFTTETIPVNVAWFTA